MAWKNHIVYLCQQKLCCRHSPTDYKVPLPAFFSSCGKKLQPVPAREPFCLFHCTTGLICNFHQEDFPVAVSPILAWGLWSVAQSPLVGHLLVVDPMDSYWSHYCWILSRMTGRSWGTLDIYIRFSGIQQPQQRGSAYSHWTLMKTLCIPLWHKEGIQQVCSRNPIFPCLSRVARDRSYSCRGTGSVLCYHGGWVQQDKAQVVLWSHGDHFQHSFVHVHLCCAATQERQDTIQE